MSILTNVFYITSVALMIPVMLALLLGLLYTLYLSGTAIHEFTDRLKKSAQRKSLIEALENKSATIPTIDDSDDFGKTLNTVLVQGDDALLVGKKIADLESVWRGELQKISDMAKYGPALGLMGTLIPLGPALVGLAEGDLATMASNMVVAFATTVVGVLISLIALAVHSAKQRWYREDSILLTFASERSAELPRVNDHSLDDIQTEAA